MTYRPSSTQHTSQAPQKSEIPVGYRHFRALLVTDALSRELERKAIIACTANFAAEDDADEELRSHDNAPGIATHSDDSEQYDPSVPSLQVYCLADVSREIGMLDARSADSDDRKRRYALLSKMHADGGRRELSQINPTRARSLLDGLDRDFPNFAEVNTFLRGEIALASADDLTMRVDPILLDGPPGCGKTEYAKRLAELYGVGHQNLTICNMSTMQTSSELCGTSSMYSNTKTGMLFDQLVRCASFANPLFLLDEIDKSQGDSRWPASAALYGLLSDNAKSWSDASESFLKIDASRVLYVLTSNYADSIEPALLSRMHRFDIKMPSQAQSRIIVANLFSELKSAIPNALFIMRLSDAATDVLTTQSPRKIRAALKTGAGLALAAGRMEILASDIMLEKVRQSIGF